MSGTFKNLPTNVIKKLVCMKYGDNSKIIELPKIKPLAKDTAIILQKTDKPILVVIFDYYEYDIYNMKGEKIFVRGITRLNNVKNLINFLAREDFNWDKVISLEKMNLKQKERLWGEDTRLTPKELSKKKRNEELNKPLMDMVEAKNKVWVEKFKKSLPNLEKLMKFLTGYEVKANVKGTINNKRYFSIEFTPEFTGNELGVLRFALKKAGFYTYCNPDPNKEKIWFPIKMGWEHHDGGTSGGEIKGLNLDIDCLWYNTKNGDWETNN